MLIAVRQIPAPRAGIQVVAQVAAAAGKLTVYFEETICMKCIPCKNYLQESYVCAMIRKQQSKKNAAQLLSGA